MASAPLHPLATDMGDPASTATDMGDPASTHPSSGDNDNDVGRVLSKRRLAHVVAT